MPFLIIQRSFMSFSEVCLFEEMTNASALSEKKPPLVYYWNLVETFEMFQPGLVSTRNIFIYWRWG
jgi:hypothetical protein